MSDYMKGLPSTRFAREVAGAFMQRGMEDLRAQLAAETARLDWLIAQSEWTQAQMAAGPRKVIDAARGAK